MTTLPNHVTPADLQEPGTLVSVERLLATPQGS